MTSLAPAAPVENLIRVIRGQKVILDADLAMIYAVPTRTLNQAVKRNANRFPGDFVFQLTIEEVVDMRCQNGAVCPAHASEENRSQIATGSKEQQGANNRSQTGIGSQKHRDPRYLPYAFTEHGAIMVANVLRSHQAIRMSVFVVRAFIRLRQVLASNAELSHKLAELEHKLEDHDGAIRDLFKTIRQFLDPPEPPRRQIGFHVRERKTTYRAGSRT